MAAASWTGQRWPAPRQPGAYWPGLNGPQRRARTLWLLSNMLIRIKEEQICSLFL